MTATAVQDQLLDTTVTVAGGEYIVQERAGIHADGAIGLIVPAAEGFEGHLRYVVDNRGEEGETARVLSVSPIGSKTRSRLMSGLISALLEARPKAYVNVVSVFTQDDAPALQRLSTGAYRGRMSLIYFYAGSKSWSIYD